MATEKLLEEFPPVSTADWEAAIANDLKDVSYEDKLIWRAPEGLVVRPYYRAENVEGLKWADAAPGKFPFVRGASAQAGWCIREEIAAHDPAEANRAALDAVAAGAEEIAFAGVAIGQESDLVLLLSNLGEIPVHFDGIDEQIAGILLGFVKSSSRVARISAGFDALTNPDFAAQLCAAATAGFVPFLLGGMRVAPAKASATEQTGWTLAAGVDFLAAMGEREIDAGCAGNAVEFGFPVGPNYFFEIARLRAFRMLWARVVESFGGARAQARARIAVRTVSQQTEPGKSHWNILRATTETMSAILGGANSICVTPFEDSGQARRLARNTQLLLKHEAFLDRVADAGGGSYYLEMLTDSIADAAWKVMQEIEAGGGWRTAKERSEMQPVRSFSRNVEVAGGAQCS